MPFLSLKCESILKWENLGMGILARDFKHKFDSSILWGQISIACTLQK